METLISAEVKAGLEQIKADIIAGKIEARPGSVPARLRWGTARVVSSTGSLSTIQEALSRA